MPGLAARDWLALTAPQLCCLLLLPAAGLSRLPLVCVACLSLSAAATLGFGRPLLFDVALAWNQLAAYHGRLIPLSEIAFLNHLKFQPPIWNWYLSAFPSFAAQQVYALAASGLTLGLCWRLYGEQTTRRIAATPLFLCMASQPMTGGYAVVSLLAARVLWQDGHRFSAVLAAWLASQWTYTAYAVYPFLCWEFGAHGAGLLLLSAGYWWLFWQTDTRTVAAQWQFVTRMFTLGAFDGARLHEVADIAARNGRRLDRNLLTCLSAGVYLFPAWTAATWWVMMMGLFIVLGGGNVKYLALLLTCLPAAARTSITFPFFLHSIFIFSRQERFCHFSQNRARRNAHADEIA